MHCPNCDVLNPPGARRCVCGYVFVFEGAPSAPRSVSSSFAAFVALAGLLGGFAGAILGTHHLPSSAREPILGLFLLLAGAFSVCGGVFDWSFFMENRRARLFVFLFTRNGARVFYGILGGVLGGVGFAFLV